MSSPTCEDQPMSLRHALLGLLAERPGSGYELTKRFELAPGNVWSASHSQIYPELRRMAGDDLVKAGAEGPRGRREYEITTAGADELHRWLTSPLPERSARDELALRVFFLWTLPTDEVLDNLERITEMCRDNLAALDELDAQIPWGAGPSDLMGRLVLEHGRRSTSTMADWAAWAADQVRAGRDATTLTDRLVTPGSDT